MVVVVVQLCLTAASLHLDANRKCSMEQKATNLFGTSSHNLHVGQYRYQVNHMV